MNVDKILLLIGSLMPVLYFASLFVAGALGLWLRIWAAVTLAAFGLLCLAVYQRRTVR